MLPILTCQAQITPVFSAGYSALLGTNTHDDQFFELQIGTGIRLNDLLSAQLNYTFANYEFVINPPGKLQPVKVDILSLSMGCRLLKKSIISPSILFDFGFPIHSNANDKLIYKGYLITTDYSEGVWRYNRGLFFGKFKLMSDLKVKSFNILLGGSYNLWFENVSWLKPGTSIGLEYYAYQTKVVDRHNFGVELGLMYTLPSKKDKQE